MPSVFYILREAGFRLLTILNQLADLRKTWYDLYVNGGSAQTVHFRCSLGGKNEHLIWSPSAYIRLSVSTFIPVITVFVGFSSNLVQKFFRKFSSKEDFHENLCLLKGINESVTYFVRYAVTQLVEALCYKPECRGFDSRWSHWDFH